jgi:hypothetical protein
MTEPTNTAPTTQPNSQEREALFTESRRLMDEALPLSTPEQTPHAETARAAAAADHEAQMRTDREARERVEAEEAPARAAMVRAITAVPSEISVGDTGERECLRHVNRRLDTQGLLARSDYSTTPRWGCSLRSTTLPALPRRTRTMRAKRALTSETKDNTFLPLRERCLKGARTNSRPRWRGGAEGRINSITCSPRQVDGAN